MRGRLHQPHRGQNGNQSNRSDLRDGRSAQRDGWFGDSSPEKLSSVPSAHAGRAGRAYVPTPGIQRLHWSLIGKLQAPAGCSPLLGRRPVLNQPYSPTMPRVSGKQCIRIWNRRLREQPLMEVTTGREQHARPREPMQRHDRLRSQKRNLRKAQCQPLTRPPLCRASRAVGSATGLRTHPRSPRCAFQVCWKLPVGA